MEEKDAQTAKTVFRQTAERFQNLPVFAQSAVWIARKGMPGLATGEFSKVAARSGPVRFTKKQGCHRCKTDPHEGHERG